MAPPPTTPKTTTKPISLLLFFFFFFFFSSSSSSSSSPNNNNLLFKGCANQKFQDPQYSKSLTSLFATLTSLSSSAKFSKTTAAPLSNSAINGLFQCRGDLTSSDCNSCVSKIPKLFDRLCGPAVAARIQLAGCYLSYEVAGFKTVSATELLYKVCGSTRVSGAGFGERLSAAIGEVEKGVVGGNGFYAAGYESVYVLGQCEGDLGSNDCVDCLKMAAQKVRTECGDSILGQLFLQQCYLTYTYQPNGVTATLPSATGNNNGKGMGGQNTQKTVAIVVGGLVGSGLFIACLLVLKSAFKKKRENKYYTYGG